MRSLTKILIFFLILSPSFTSRTLAQSLVELISVQSDLQVKQSNDKQFVTFNARLKFAATGASDNPGYSQSDSTPKSLVFDPERDDLTLTFNSDLKFGLSIPAGALTQVVENVYRNPAKFSNQSPIRVFIEQQGNIVDLKSDLFIIDVRLFFDENGEYTLDFFSLTNPTPIGGGSDGEDPEDPNSEASRAVRTLSRISSDQVELTIGNALLGEVLFSEGQLTAIKSVHR